MGSLAPLPGFVLLVAGQALLDFLLIRPAEDDLRRHSAHLPQTLPSLRLCVPAKGDAPDWKTAFRREFAKWGLFLTMILFTVLLVDRVAEVLAIASLGFWLLLNLPIFTRAHPSQP